MRAVVVDPRAEEVAREEVTDDAQRELGLLVDERRRLGALCLRLDRLPQPLEEDEVALDVLGGRALGGRAHDDPAALRIEVLDDVLQTVALGVLEPSRDAGALPVRDVDEEAAGQRDLGREPRALRLHRILDRLHHDRLAALDQVLDLARALPALELRADDLVDVEEPVLLEPDLDERGLHARQDVVDDAQVDVAGDRAALRALEVDLGDAIVLEDRDALLADVDRDDELALRRRQRCTLGGRPSAVPAASLALVRGLRCWLGRGLRPRGCRRGTRGRGNGLCRCVTIRLRRACRLLASLSAARTAATSLFRARLRALLVGGLARLRS